MRKFGISAQHHPSTSSGLRTEQALVSFFARESKIEDAEISLPIHLSDILSSIALNFTSQLTHLFLSDLDQEASDQLKMLIANKSTLRTVKIGSECNRLGLVQALWIIHKSSFAFSLRRFPFCFSIWVSDSDHKELSVSLTPKMTIFAVNGIIKEKSMPIYEKLIIYDFAWCIAAIIFSFFRANRSHPFAHSICPLIPFILNSDGPIPKDFTGLNSKCRFLCNFVNQFQSGKRKRADDF